MKKVHRLKFANPSLAYSMFIWDTTRKTCVVRIKERSECQVCAVFGIFERRNYTTVKKIMSTKFYLFHIAK